MNNWVIVDSERSGNDRMVFWRMERRGYTYDLNQAGRYSEQEAVNTQINSAGRHIALDLDGSGFKTSTIIVLDQTDNCELWNYIKVRAKAGL